MALSANTALVLPVLWTGRHERRAHGRASPRLGVRLRGGGDGIHETVEAIVAQWEGMPLLVCTLLYGAGLRLSEALRGLKYIKAVLAGNGNG